MWISFWCGFIAFLCVRQMCVDSLSSMCVCVGGLRACVCVGYRDSSWLCISISVHNYMQNKRIIELKTWFLSAVTINPNACNVLRLIIGLISKHFQGLVTYFKQTFYQWNISTVDFCIWINYNYWLLIKFSDRRISTKQNHKQDTTAPGKEYFFVLRHK